MMNTMMLLLAALLGIGCTMETREPATAATTQATGAVRMVRLSSAWPIAKFRGEDRDLDLRQIIHVSGSEDLYFGQADSYNNGGEVKATQPVVVASVNGAWMVLSLKDDRLSDAEWQFVASGPSENEIWGVLDDTLE